MGLYKICNHKKRERDRCDPARRAWRHFVLAAQDELLPQARAVLASGLGGNR